MSRTTPLVGSSTPEIMLKKVLLPAPFGADQCMHLAGLHVHRDGVVGDETAEALGHAVGLEQQFAGGRQLAAVQRRDRRRWLRRLGLEEATGDAGQRRPEPLGKALQHEQHQEAEDDHLEIAAGAQQLRQQVLQLLLDQRDQGRAEHRAPQVARAPDHRHEQVLDADVDVERRRVHEALQVGVEPARQGRQQAASTNTLTR
jgi:hypothetical protein